MLFDEILAQPGAVAILQRAAQRGKLAHSYLFEGPSGVGKQKTALALAAAAICRETAAGCGKCERCRRVLAGIHPDVRVYSPRQEGNHNIPVELLREEVLPYTRFAPFESDAAFVIFPQADVSFPPNHPEAANALLKTLEEPRPKLHFLLLSERPDRLLPTIRSRCQRLRFGPLPAEVIDRILLAASVAEPARKAAAVLADGRADRALELAGEGKAERMLEMSRRIHRVTAAQKFADMLDLSEELAKSDDLALILETLTRCYRELTAHLLGCAEHCFGMELGELGTSPGRRALGAGDCAERVGLIQRAGEAMERNANRQITLDALLFELAGC
jgi:DNA polymerase III subunit delta'